MYLHAELPAVLLLGVVAGTLGGVIGFGSSIMLMPVLVMLYGPREAVPIMAVAALLGNASRVLVWWRDVHWRAVAAYAVTGVPAAALGASTLLTISQRWSELVMGCFFLAVIPGRRWLARHNLRVALWGLAVCGALIGYLTGIVVSTGPINAPFFLGFGLIKGAYLGSEALGSLALYLSKAIVFRSFGALPAEIFINGMIIGSSLMAGSFLAKRLVPKLAAEQFSLLIEALLLVSGLTLLGAALLGL
ncbi:MAG: sulfite exporter TauE/SafE family protein [Burkholderiales bacterium]